MLTMQSLPYKKKVMEVILSDDLFVEQWIITKGTVVKTQETKNFGWLILPKGCKDKRGFEIPKRIFKY